MTDIHEQLCALLDQEGATYRVIEHEPEGRTELIAKIRGNRIEQSIKSMTLQVRLTRKENIYCLANVPGNCRIDFDGVKRHFNADSVATGSREKAQELTGCVIGALPPFTFSDQLQVLADPLIGLAFSRVEEEFFGRGFLSLGYMFVAWSEAFRSLWGSKGNAAASYAVEFMGIILGFTASISGLRRYPDLAWLSLLVVFLSFTSGPAQGMHRYVLGAPALFLFLARQGEKPAFDRIWTLASILLMGMMATMYMFDMWAG